MKEIRSTLASRDKTHAQLVERWANPEARLKYGAQMKAKSRDWHSKRIASMLAFNSSGKKTKLEKKVEIFLLDHKLPFKYVGDGTHPVGPLFPDFVSTNGSKIIIDAHGCYWHRCAKCFPNPKVKTTSIPYKQRISTYAKHGYRTIVIWEHELNDPNWQANLVAKIAPFIT